MVRSINHWMGVSVAPSVVTTFWRPDSTSSVLRATESSGLIRPPTWTGSSAKASISKSESDFAERSPPQRMTATSRTMRL